MLAEPTQGRSWRLHEFLVNCEGIRGFSWPHRRVTRWHSRLGKARPRRLRTGPPGAKLRHFAHADGWSIVA